MDYGKLSTSILGAIERKPEDIGAYEDLFSACQTWAQEDFKAAHRANKQLLDMYNGLYIQGGWLLRPVETELTV